MLQLLSICHYIHTDENLIEDVRGLVLNISKAFDKVWHETPTFKLKAYGIKGELLSSLENYHQISEQRAVLYGQT